MVHGKRYIVNSFRQRFQRLLQPLPPSVVETALLDRVFQLLDLLFVFDAYETISNLLTAGLRKLTAGERHHLYTIFGDSVPYDRIRIDERAQLGPRRYRFCYVSFHTINSWGTMSLPTLVHEVVHVWQYVHDGAIYIPRALAAQRTVEGYNYGGRRGLAVISRLYDLNYEQQADLVEDAYRLANYLPAQWIPGATAAVLPEFYPFLRELQARPLSVAYINTGSTE